MTMEADQVVQLLLRERLRIAAVATAILRDVHAADDIFQQVVLAGLEQRTHFHDPDHLLAWAIRTARHRAIDMCRRRHAFSLPDDVLDQLESEWAGATSGEWSERMEALHRCMGRLAAPAREMLQMKYADGLTAPSIAGELGRSLNAVYQGLSRIHRTLRDCVGRELDRIEGLTEKAMS